MLTNGGVINWLESLLELQNMTGIIPRWINRRVLWVNNAIVANHCVHKWMILYESKKWNVRCVEYGRVVSLEVGVSEQPDVVNQVHQTSLAG